MNSKLAGTTMYKHFRADTLSKELLHTVVPASLLFIFKVTLIFHTVFFFWGGGSLRVMEEQQITTIPII